MARKLPATDVVIIGLGWTGSIMASELTDAGLNVVAIERGAWRDTSPGKRTSGLARHRVNGQAPARI